MTRPIPSVSSTGTTSPAGSAVPPVAPVAPVSRSRSLSRGAMPRPRAASRGSLSTAPRQASALSSVSARHANLPGIPGLPGLNALAPPDPNDPNQLSASLAQTCHEHALKDMNEVQQRRSAANATLADLGESLRSATNPAQ